jgi:hypothetical protein
LNDVASPEGDHRDGLAIDEGASLSGRIPQIGYAIGAGGNFEVQTGQAVSAGQRNIAFRSLAESEVPRRQIKHVTSGCDQAGHRRRGLKLEFKKGAFLNNQVQ